MKGWLGEACVVGLWIASLGLWGCETGCSEETVARAERYLESHQSCRFDSDCVTVSDFCGEIGNGLCGSIVMNRDGENTAEWQELEEELADCAPSDCSDCEAAVVPACGSLGSCAGP
jgi:hypothetical protein